VGTERTVRSWAVLSFCLPRWRGVPPRPLGLAPLEQPLGQASQDRRAFRIRSRIGGSIPCERQRQAPGRRALMARETVDKRHSGPIRAERPRRAGVGAGEPRTSGGPRVRRAGRLQEHRSRAPAARRSRAKYYRGYVPNPPRTGRQAPGHRPTPYPARPTVPASPKRLRSGAWSSHLHRIDPLIRLQIRNLQRSWEASPSGSWIGSSVPSGSRSRSRPARYHRPDT
jgi:hypothetical protein